MTTLGAWLKTQGFTVDDDNVPLGRMSTWHGVDYIVVHHTASSCQGAESDIAAYVRHGGKGTFPPLAQIMLGGSGKVWMTCRERPGQRSPGRASHAGQGRGWGVPPDRMNEYSLGIECQCIGSHPLRTHPKLYATLIDLVAALCRKYGVPPSKVLGHKEWSSTGKVDPRDSMDTIRADVAAALKDQTTEKVKTLAVQTFKHGAYYKTPLDEPLKLTARKAGYDIAVVDLPADKECLLTFQARTLKGVPVPLEAEFVRLNWPGLAATDETGHGQFAPATDIFGEWHRWRTINHAIQGGGKVSFRVYIPEGATGEYRFVCKSDTV